PATHTLPLHDALPIYNCPPTAISAIRSKEFTDVEPQANACTRIRSTKGAVPRCFKLMLRFSLPSFSITKVRKKPSGGVRDTAFLDRKSTRLNSSHVSI